MQSLLDTLLVKAVCHDRGLDVLAVGKLEELAEGIARAGQGALHADALEGERGQRNGGALESGSEGVDAAVGVDDRDQAGRLLVVSSVLSNVEIHTCCSQHWRYRREGGASRA